MIINARKYSTRFDVDTKFVIENGVSDVPRLKPASSSPRSASAESEHSVILQWKTVTMSLSYLGTY